MKSFVDSLRGSTKTCFTSVTIKYVELLPHDNATTGILGLVDHKAGAMKIKIGVQPIVHHWKDLFLEPLFLVVGVYQRIRPSHVRTTVHEYVLLARMAMEITVNFYFTAF